MGACPALSDGVVTVRPYRADDVDDVFEAGRESIAEIAPWMPWCHAGYQRSEAAEWVAAQPEMRIKGECPLVVVDAISGRFLGSAGNNDVHPEHRKCNLGYWIRTSATGNGYAVRAARLSGIIALREMDLLRAEILVAVGNERSVRVAEKVGATHEGIQRHRLSLHGEPIDAHMYSLTRDDLPRLLADAGLQ